MAETSQTSSSQTPAMVVTTVLTITSCSDHACTKVPITTGLQSFTTSTNGVTTVYTTYCPLTDEPSNTLPSPSSAVASTKISSNGLLLETSSSESSSSNEISTSRTVSSTTLISLIATSADYSITSDTISSSSTATSFARSQSTYEAKETSLTSSTISYTTASLSASIFEGAANHLALSKNIIISLLAIAFL